MLLGAAGNSDSASQYAAAHRLSSGRADHSKTILVPSDADGGSTLARIASHVRYIHCSDQYKRHRLYTARLFLQGFTDEFPEGSPEGGVIYDGRAKKGHYMKRVYLPTRTALWFLLTGRFGELKMPCHWWLVIADRME